MRCHPLFTISLALKISLTLVRMDSLPVDLQKVCSCFKWATCRLSHTAKCSQYKWIVWQVLTNASSLEPALCLRGTTFPLPFTKADLTSVDIPTQELKGSPVCVECGQMLWPGLATGTSLEKKFSYPLGTYSQYSNQLSKSMSILPIQACTKLLQKDSSRLNG